MAENIYQSWSDEKYCKNYADIWGISTDEVHYGWLSPGENELKLLEGIDFPNAKILDIGCGMGENLLALSKKGAACYGIDISEHMLKYANKKIKDTSALGKIDLNQDDMRNISSFSGITFDIVLSIYSLEYLRNILEFRAVMWDVYNRLTPGGTFVFCFSHPLQHAKHKLLHNISAHSDFTEKSNIIYSFRDVIATISSINFTIERIIEQGTKNPSQISYDEAQKYPYHFAQGQNPCLPIYDSTSNSAPHTVIYKVKKPAEKTKQSILFAEDGDKLQIWSTNRTITHTITLQDRNLKYSINQLAPKDSVVSVCEVLKFEIEEEDLKLNESKDKITNVKIKNNCLLNIILHRLHNNKLRYRLETSTTTVEGQLREAVFIKNINPIYEDIKLHYPSKKYGILVFVNGKEPAEGSIGLQDITPFIGDIIQVVYIITQWGSSWRKCEIGNNNAIFFDEQSNLDVESNQQGLLFD
jgi:ubiquinone/menaquinone biosynthesis C-methylase UbiE